MGDNTKIGIGSKSDNKDEIRVNKELKDELGNDKKKKEKEIGRYLKNYLANYK